MWIQVTLKTKDLGCSDASGVRCLEGVARLRGGGAWRGHQSVLLRFQEGL